MSQRNTFVRSLNDVGLAAWFGGSLAGAVAINGAASDVPDPAQRLTVANAGWARWSPVNLVAIGAHLVGAAGLLYANKGRVASQRGVGVSSTVRTGLTLAALGATAYSGRLGLALQGSGGTPVTGGTTPGSQTPPGIAGIQRRLGIMQWVIPALTGSLAVMNAYNGEQQRPGQQIAGILGKPGRIVAGALS